MVQLIYKQSEVNLMSHPVNDEIIENLYCELVEEYRTDLLSWSQKDIDAEVMRRFEAMSM